MVFGVRHLGKDVSRGALSSVLGSTAWVDVPREVILMAVDDEDQWVYHAQVVAGNRGPRNSGRVFRLELVDVPPATEITLAVAQGDSDKDVEALLGRGRGGGESASRSAQARELILDILEREGDQESDALDARVAKEIGIKAKTVQNIRSKLTDEGLIRAYPDRDDSGAVLRWNVGRTLAPGEGRT
jgi:predicted transcriptional regulator